MSRRWERQSAFPGVLAERGRGITLDWGTSVPADATPGYAPGCIFIDIDATAGLQLFVNEGTFASCDFNALMPGGGLVALTGSTTITRATHGYPKVLSMTGTGAAYTQTLPAAAGLGTRYQFVVGAVNTSNHVIQVANSSDVMYGQIVTCSTGETPDLAQPWITASDSDTITLNGTTKGGLAIGDMIELIDIATNKWMVLGFTTSNGTEATPFSAAV